MVRQRESTVTATIASAGTDTVPKDTDFALTSNDTEVDDTVPRDTASALTRNDTELRDTASALTSR